MDISFQKLWFNIKLMLQLFQDMKKLCVFHIIFKLLIDVQQNVCSVPILVGGKNYKLKWAFVQIFLADRYIRYIHRKQLRVLWLKSIPRVEKIRKTFMLIIEKKFFFPGFIEIWNFCEYLIFVHFLHNLSPHSREFC